jgi:hypothetical protein
MITISSFNEWHQGTQIEPATMGMSNDQGYAYTDYGDLGPEGYIHLTRELVHGFLETEWQPRYRARIRIVTTSDWTRFMIVNGASWIRSSVVVASEEAGLAGLVNGEILLEQPINRAEAGEAVELVIDIFFTGLDPDGTISLRIERGHLGWTEVELFNYRGDEPILIETLRYDEAVDVGRNMATFQIPAAEIITHLP